MPVQIGAKPHTFSDPTGLLSDCHRRIEMFMRSLERVAQLMDKPADEETRRALATALSYFREAAPKHTADEEESLFPRLRALNSPEIRTALSKLEGLESDHRWAEPLHNQLESLGRRYLDSGALSHVEIEEFRLLVSRLSAMYKRHIAIEDGDLFPVAAKALADRDKQGIAEEMAKRRAAPPIDPGGRP